MAELNHCQQSAQEIRNSLQYVRAENFHRRLIVEIRAKLAALDAAYERYQDNYKILSDNASVTNREDLLPHYGHLYAEVAQIHRQVRTILVNRLKQAEQPADERSSSDSESNNESDDKSEQHSTSSEEERPPAKVSKKKSNKREKANSIKSTGRDENTAATSSAPNQSVQSAQSIVADDRFAALIERMCTGVANRKENTWGTYDGDLGKWQGFYDAFKAAVHKDPLIAPVVKFQMLKASLRGKAAEQLGEWPIGNENYREAWKWLKLQNKRKYQTSQLILMKLVNFKPIEKPSGYWLETLSAKAQEVVRRLRAMKYPVEQMDLVWVHLIHSKMDPETSRDWELKRPSEKPTFNEIISFLQARGRALSNVKWSENKNEDNRKRHATDHSNGHQNDNKRQKKEFSQTNKADKSVKKSSNGEPCKLCNDGSHYIQFCKKFGEMNTKSRQNVARERNLCWNCLNPAHQVRDCKARNCKNCDGKHHTMLCKKAQNAAAVNTANVTKKGKKNEKKKEPNKEKTDAPVSSSKSS